MFTQSAERRKEEDQCDGVPPRLPVIQGVIEAHKDKDKRVQVVIADTYIEKVATKG